MARVGVADPPSLVGTGRSSGRQSYGPTPPPPPIWTVHGSVGGNYSPDSPGYGTVLPPPPPPPIVAAVTDTRRAGREDIYGVGQQEKQRTYQQIPLLKVRVDNAGYQDSELSLSSKRPYMPTSGVGTVHHHHHLRPLSDPGSPGAKLKKRPLCRFWKLRFPQGPAGSPSRRFVALLLVPLACLVILAAAAVLVYTFYNRSKVDFRKEEIRQDLESSWAVDGSFRVTNRGYSPELMDHSSRAFKSLASEVARALGELFSLGPLASDYNMTQVSGFSYSEGSIGVECRIILNQPLTNAAHQVGLAFVQLLEQGHGMLPAGNLHVDIRSLKFTGVKSGEVLPQVLVTHGPSYFDAAWSAWSSWTDCIGLDGRCIPNRMRSRRRDCRSHHGRRTVLPDNLACLEQGGKEVEFNNCLCSSPTTTTVATTPEPTRPPDGHNTNSVGLAANSTPSTTAQPITKHLEQTASQSSAGDRRPCHSCLAGEICFMASKEATPHCVKPKDLDDPRGCGGWCSGPNELCRRLDNVTFHCVDDSECLHDEWQCSNGLCIPEQRRCDGHFNCYDMTDEYNCECGSDGFHCGNNTSCLPLDRRCNGFVDCWDGSDEANCTALCPTSQHTCNSGQCVPLDFFCDSFRDCDDGSDEPPGCDSPCLPHQKQCLNGRCVPSTVWCDGFDSCGDGSDEANCSGTPARNPNPLLPLQPNFRKRLMGAKGVPPSLRAR
ncbi:uncharacterized protein LOC135393832 isoform X2 [Ornithodoros turicata]|uniref:uncharacterized protein LOC135393832 isoform X2 n=1 Tax=Ornithodoros turicata TaxID=34597 RepID=UPI003139B118